MTGHSTKWWPLVVALASASVAGCSADKTTAPVAVDRPADADVVSDSLAIRAVVGRIDAAWAAMDPTAYAREFATDAQFVSIIGVRMVGQTEIQARHQFLFTGPFRGSRLQNTIQRQRFLGPASASVETDAQLTGYVVLPPGATETAPGVLRSRFLHVLQKVNGVWTIRSGTNTAIAPG